MSPATSSPLAPGNGGTALQGAPAPAGDPFPGLRALVDLWMASPDRGIQGCAWDLRAELDVLTGDDLRDAVSARVEENLRLVQEHELATEGRVHDPERGTEGARAAAISGLGLAAIGRAHFGNPIPQQWYAAARDLMARLGRAGGDDGQG